MSEVKRMDQELKELLLEMRKDIKAIDRRTERLESDVVEIKQRVTKTEIALENNVQDTLSVLLEGQSGMNEQLKKLDDVAAREEDIQITVNALESATKDNTSQIRELRAIK